ncbi:MAG: glycerate kinase [Solobacterium sp.]|jgi:hydroxypyruvate reductase|nr:glycerate kinase [Solobacterium sp.]MCH4205950.1 glycerate kinase [Solobacterium sp.]MCH4226217.1 glycerate kinase [Solobacterium sp.]MCH4282738.1 glycerate kinase [Solobacterium sp.]
MEQIKADAHAIIDHALKTAMPGPSVQKALQKMSFGTGRIYVLSIGKAAYTMAEAAQKVLGERIAKGICITKYGHVKGTIPGFACYEAGHPITDENGIAATQKAMAMVQGLNEKDTVLVLISGGGSALFESPAVPLADYNAITEQLLKCGADIHEINTVRKHLSHVKGGRFAQLCAPAEVIGIALSDVLGNDSAVIASGPISPDPSTCMNAEEILQKYQILISENVRLELEKETPKVIKNAEIKVIGSVKTLCLDAEKTCEELGYHALILNDALCCEAKDAGLAFGQKAKEHQPEDQNIALIAGGETVVHVAGNGLGGRNQEMALACAKEIAGMKDVCFFSLGSDGTDGPTDAAGGIVDGHTKEELLQQGICIETVLKNNDAYHALQKCHGLIMTGPTGTNLNDLSVLLIRNGQ